MAAGLSFARLGTFAGVIFSITSSFTASSSTGSSIITTERYGLALFETIFSNKAKPYLSVVMMDDPVLLLAVKEDVIEKITPAKVPNLAKLKPAAIHMDGMWTNYQQPYATIALATAKLKAPPASWTELWDPKYKGKVIVPSLQNT